MNSNIKPPFHKFYITLILIAANFLGPIGLDIYMPAIPHITKLFNTSAHVLQYSMTIYSLGFAVGVLIFGALSDRFGRKPIMIISLLFFIAGSILLLTCSQVDGLLISRLIQGFGTSVGPVLGRAMINDTHDLTSAMRKNAILFICMLSMPALGPIIGAYLFNHLGLDSIFIVMLAFGAALFIAVCLLLPESIEHKDLNSIKPKFILSNLMAFAKNPKYTLSVVCCTTAFAGYFVVITVAPFIMQWVLHIAITTFGLLFALITTGFILGAYIARHLTGRVNPLKIMLFGNALSFVSVLVLLLLLYTVGLSLPIFIIFVWLFYFGCGVTFPNAVSFAVNCFSKQAGLASAVTSFSYWMLGTAAGTLLTIFSVRSAFPLTYFLIALSAMSLLATILLKSYSSSHSQ